MAPAAEAGLCQGTVDIPEESLEWKFCNVRPCSADPLIQAEAFRGQPVYLPGIRDGHSRSASDGILAKPGGGLERGKEQMRPDHPAFHSGARIRYGARWFPDTSILRAAI